jgi:hypothetical protein
MTPLLVKLLNLVGNTNLDSETRAEAFWAASELIWKHTDKQIERNPWSERILINMMEHKNLAVSGCASSGKSCISGAYVTMMFWSNPTGTKIMVTSTDIKGAKNRIWAQVCEFFMSGQKSRRLPGRLINSINLIIPDNDSEEAISDRMGIQLYSGETKKEKECIQKWIGIKNRRVILVLDEMPYLGPQLIAAAQSNLMSNAYFQMIGLGNFRSKLDPFGQFANPAKGWESVDVETEEWETNCNGIKGWCIRLDGVKSPNVLAGRDLWDGIYSNETFRLHCRLGPKSPGFWQMCRSFPTPQGIGNQIYSETHFDGCYGGRPTWLTKKTLVAALDPAFTNGGDRTQMIIAEFGDTSAGDHLHIIHYEELTSDVTKSDPRDYQIARIYRDRCKKFGVKPENAGLDATGSGGGLFSIMSVEWSTHVVPVFFWGAASERPSSTVDFRPGHEVYFNRSAELWDQGREYFARKMITGVTVELAQELCSREYDKIGGIKIKVESKKDMKERIGKSPDLADAFLILLELCRQRFNFMPNRALGTEVASVDQSMAQGDHGYYLGLDDSGDAGSFRSDEYRRDSDSRYGSGPEEAVKRALALAQSPAFNGRPSNDVHNPHWGGDAGLHDW